jgi:acyl carrier protein
MSSSRLVIGKTVSGELNRVLRDKGATERDFRDSDVLIDEELDSLDLAIVVVTLEEELGVDPFREGREGVRTFGELVSAYIHTLERGS